MLLDCPGRRAAVVETTHASLHFVVRPTYVRAVLKDKEIPMLLILLIGRRTRFGRRGSFHNRLGRKQTTRLSQKGLDFGSGQSVSADDARVLMARDPAPPAIGLLRGFGGDGTDVVDQRRKAPRHDKQQD